MDSSVSKRTLISGSGSVLSVDIIRGRGGSDGCGLHHAWTTTLDYLGTKHHFTIVRHVLLHVLRLDDANTGPRTARLALSRISSSHPNRYTCGTRF